MKLQITESSKEPLRLVAMPPNSIIVGDVEHCAHALAKMMKAHLALKPDDTILTNMEPLLTYKHANVSNALDKEPDVEANYYRTLSKAAGHIKEDSVVFEVEPRKEPPEWLLSISGVVYCKLRLSDIYQQTRSQQELSKSDWEVLKALERIYLADTELHKQREALRNLVDEELAACKH